MEQCYHSIWLNKINKTTLSMPKMTTSGADAAINQADSASPLARTDITVIAIAIERSLLPQRSQETTSSLPSNQLASQLHLLKPTQLIQSNNSQTNTCRTAKPIPAATTLFFFHTWLITSIIHILA